jgi:hypothetical protein
MINTKKIFFIWLIFIGIFFGAYYFWYEKEVQIVTIEPEAGPIKVRPEEPGGIVIPNTDSLIYNQEIFNKKRIQLLPDPEEPINIPRPVLDNSLEQVIYTDSIDDILNNLERYEKLYNELGSNTDLTNDEVQNGIIESIRTQEVAVNEPINSEKEKEVNPYDLEIQKATTKRRWIKNNINQNGYLVQLGVAFNENDASHKWQLIKKKHNKLLGKREMILQKGQGSNGKFFYLIMTGYYESFSDAKYVCRQLIAQKQSCIITK